MIEIYSLPSAGFRGARTFTPRADLAALYKTFSILCFAFM